MFGRPAPDRAAYSRPPQQSALHDERSHSHYYRYSQPPPAAWAPPQQAPIYFIPHNNSDAPPPQQPPQPVYYPASAVEPPPQMASQRSVHSTRPSVYLDDPAFSSDPRANPLVRYSTYAMNSQEEIHPAAGSQVSTTLHSSDYPPYTLSPPPRRFLYLVDLLSDILSRPVSRPMPPARTPVLLCQSAMYHPSMVPQRPCRKVRTSLPTSPPSISHRILPRRHYIIINPAQRAIIVTTATLRPMLLSTHVPLILRPPIITIAKRGTLVPLMRPAYTSRTKTRNVSLFPRNRRLGTRSSASSPPRRSIRIQRKA